MDNLHILQPKLRKITNLFQHPNIGISFKSTNTLQQLTKSKLNSNTQEQDKSGIYKLTSNTCQMPYIGQTSRGLKQRYREHVRYIRHNKPQSAYALHILNNKYEYDLINNTMTLLKHINKTSLLLPYEQLNIPLSTQQNQFHPDITIRRQHNWVCKQKISLYRQNLLHFLEYFYYFKLFI
jgi:phosphoribulokinase